MRAAGKIAIAVIAAGVAALPGGVLAAGTESSVYDGTFSNIPNSEIHLTFTREGGRTALTSVDWEGTPIACENGNEILGASYPSLDGGRVRHRSFRIRYTAPENHYVFLLQGDLAPGGHAGGKLRWKGEDVFQDSGICDTGKLPWIAERATQP